MYGGVCAEGGGGVRGGALACGIGSLAACPPAAAPINKPRVQQRTCWRVQVARSGSGRLVMVPSGCTPAAPGTGLGPVHHQSGRSPLGPLTSSASPLQHRGRGEAAEGAGRGGWAASRASSGSGGTALPPFLPGPVPGSPAPGCFLSHASMQRWQGGARSCDTVQLCGASAAFGAPLAGADGPHACAMRRTSGCSSTPRPGSRSCLHFC